MMVVDRPSSVPSLMRIDQGTMGAREAPTTPGKRLAVVDKSQVAPEVRKAAEGMEAMFIDYMMQVMRNTGFKDETNPESSAQEIWKGMRDSEFAKSAARAGGVGLADQIIAYLQSERYTLKKEPEAQKGGAHEGHTNR